MKMGVTIEYYTKSDVKLDEVKAIVAAANEPDSQPWLLCEPINFLQMSGFENQLFGASKLNLMPHPDEKAEAEANYNSEQNDLTFLLNKLEELSKRFGVAWVIQLEGSPIGSIENGVCEPAVRDAIEAMADLADEFGDLEEFM